MLSVTVTPVADTGPASLTTMVYVIGSPVPYGGGEAVLEIATSVAVSETAIAALVPLIDAVTVSVAVIV